jgi:hypothetical protein
MVFHIVDIGLKTGRKSIHGHADAPHPKLPSRDKVIWNENVS